MPRAACRRPAGCWRRWRRPEGRLEATLLEVHEGLHDLLAGVHDERAVAGDRLAQRAPGHEDQARAVLAALEHDAVAAAEDPQLVLLERARILALADAGTAFEHVGESIVAGRQRIPPRRARLERDVQVDRRGRRLVDRPAHGGAI